jgi:probable addiction module antidote protein
MNKLDMASVSHEDGLLEHLRSDPGFATEYLRVALEEEEDPGALLMALRHVAKAFGGVQHVAKEAGVNRESLYRSLSAKGNPTLKTVRAILKPMGLRLTVEKIDETAHAVR